VGRVFTDQIIPLVKAKAGELEHPWAELNPSQIQEVVDHVFGCNTYTVVADDVWCGLVSDLYWMFEALTYLH